jgi:hypothetical protein
MIPHGFGHHQRQGEHHVMLACVAVLLSAVVHVVCMYVFSDWAFGAASGARERVRERFDGERVPPMRVETMRADPMRIAAKVAGERDTPSRGPIEAGDNVEALSQSASPVLTVPPPIPREALAPGVPALKEVVPEQIDTAPWMPRQEIAQIFDRTVQDDVATLPRREIPLIERVSKAPDIVPSIDLAGRRFGRDPEPPKPFEAAEIFDTKIEKGTFAPPVAEIPAPAGGVTPGATGEQFAAKPGEKADGADDAERLRQQQERLRKQLEEVARPGADGTPPPEEERRAREAQAQIAALRESVDYVPIDDLLAVGLETYRDPAEPGCVYFRVGIEPRADKALPIIAKDIVFVQDVSGSVTEERMVFCRRALAAALKTLNTGDRFNVIAFRDTYESCFPEWAAASAENVKKAETFVGGMRAFGQTDLFASLRGALTRLPRDPARPMIAVVVTDGKPTAGVTGDAKIISAFTRLNGGNASVYMFGVQGRANTYLLDMLTTCNRGYSAVLRGSRWDIPIEFQPLAESVRNLVAGDITVAFDSASRSEVYPRKNPVNLYKGNQLNLYGVCPEGTKELIFQLRGLAAGKGYESLFRLDLERQGKAGAAAIKQHWAYRKMYELTGDWFRDGKQETMAAMLKVSQQYGVPVPVKEE